MFGQMITYNDGINVDPTQNGHGPGLQTVGVNYIRNGKFSISHTNDMWLYSYLIDWIIGNDVITDAGWTGGIILNYAGIEFGYQNFTGDFDKLLKDDYKYPDFVKQNPYQRAFNKAYNFIRVKNIRLERSLVGWLQNDIHRRRKIGIFEYEEININDFGLSATDLRRSVSK